MRVEIYTKEDCGYCNMAKALLVSKNIAYTEKVLSVDFTREELLSKYSLARSFPVIVVDGFYIGGYTNLVEHLEKNSTEQVLLVETPAPAPAPEPAPEPVVVAAPEPEVAPVEEKSEVVEEPEAVPLKIPTTATATRKYSR